MPHSENLVPGYTIIGQLLYWRLRKRTRNTTHITKITHIKKMAMCRSAADSIRFCHQIHTLTMMFWSLTLIGLFTSLTALQPISLRSSGVSRTTSSMSSTSLDILPDDQASVLEQIKLIIAADDYPKVDEEFDAVVKSNFVGAMSNQELETAVVGVLEEKGFTADNTLLATSFCADELSRNLEDDFIKMYGNNFNLGGLAGFPFAGNTGFSAMSAHIPDDGFCLIIHGPPVGITKDGVIGRVEREGISLVDSCCASAIAASNYLEGITDGGAQIAVNLRSFTDFQQRAVQKLILPHGKRLSDAENRMLELPYALYDSQDLLMQEIVKAGAGGLKKGTALLGGIQINTAPDTPDYFHPLRFDYIDSSGEVIEDLLPLLTSAEERGKNSGENRKQNPHP